MSTSGNKERYIIDSKESLCECIAVERRYYRLPSDLKRKMISVFAQYPTVLLQRFLLYLRKEEYYINTANGDPIKGMIGLLYERKKNRLGNRIGIEISPNCFGKGLTIYHPGSIIVNSTAQIGENCRLHGANCIGNNGKTSAAPRIGNNVDIGYGAVVIGDIEVADDVVIGANAVVNKSILIPGSVVVGVPGRVINAETEINA